jgi:hypothetical protein
MTVPWWLHGYRERGAGAVECRSVELPRSRSSGEGKPLGEGARQYRSGWVFRVADGAMAAC